MRSSSLLYVGAIVATIGAVLAGAASFISFDGPPNADAFRRAQEAAQAAAAGKLGMTLGLGSIGFALILRSFESELSQDRMGYAIAGALVLAGLAVGLV